MFLYDDKLSRGCGLEVDMMIMEAVTEGFRAAISVRQQVPIRGVNLGKLGFLRQWNARRRSTLTNY